MVEDVASSRMGLPSFIVKIGMSVIKGTIKNKINFDITKLDPLNSSKKLLIPAAFISAEEDTLVLPKRITEYCNGYNHPTKKIIRSQFEHNSDREEDVLQEAFAFIRNILASETDKDIEGYGQVSNAVSQSRKFIEEDRYARAKSRELEYQLEGEDEKEELAMFFNNMDFMRDQQPAALRRANIQIFNEEEEQTELDIEARRKLAQLTGRGSHTHSTSVGEHAPIKLQGSMTYHPSDTFIQNQTIVMTKSPVGAIRGQQNRAGFGGDALRTSNLLRSPDPTYIVPLKPYHGEVSFQAINKSRSMPEQSLAMPETSGQPSFRERVEAFSNNHNDRDEARQGLIEQHSRRPRSIDIKNFEVQKVAIEDCRYSWKNIAQVHPESEDLDKQMERPSISFFEVLQRDLIDPLVRVFDPLDPDYRDPVDGSNAG